VVGEGIIQSIITILSQFTKRGFRCLQLQHA